MVSGTTIPLLVVATLGVAFTQDAVQVANQSQQAIVNAQPIASPLAAGRQRQMETPEVVLSVKYDRGNLDGIYLAQYRKGRSTAAPTVLGGTQLCLDLCHAGLGGGGCGATCSDLVPVGLLEMTQQPTESGDHAGEATVEETTPVTATALMSGNIGTPRVGVCPTLCNNNLGHPLCGCASYDDNRVIPNWGDVCAAFCDNSYTLRGCPECERGAAAVAGVAARLLDTVAGWRAWCSLQCRQGQGGAACSCDLAPFSI